jgi:hypothetical protein
MSSRSCGCCELTPEERRRRLQLPEGYDAVPLCSIDILLQSVTEAMNAIPVTDDFDLVKATRLYYTVMCLKKYFPEWGVCMRPFRLPARGNSAGNNSANDQAGENQQRLESSDSEQSNQDEELDDSDTEPLIPNS